VGRGRGCAPSPLLGVAAAFFCLLHFQRRRWCGSLSVRFFLAAFSLFNQRSEVSFVAFNSVFLMMRRLETSRVALSRVRFCSFCVSWRIPMGSLYMRGREGMEVWGGLDGIWVYIY